MSDKGQALAILAEEQIEVTPRANHEDLLNASQELIVPATFVFLDTGVSQLLEAKDGLLVEVSLK